jgi:Flp pilus assembly pilin Flp
MKQSTARFKQFLKDEKGGPGLEEAVLLVFVGLVVANAADSLGDIIQKSYASATNALKTALGIQ